MNQFLHKMGMPTLWAMTDVYGLDDMLLDMLPQPVVALMLLFPINDKVKLIHIWHLLTLKLSNPKNIKCWWKFGSGFNLKVINYEIKLYFVIKIVITYCEKKMLKWLRKTFEFRGWRPRIFKIFKVTWTIYSNNERTKQFLLLNRMLF